MNPILANITIHVVYTMRLCTKLYQNLMTIERHDLQKGAECDKIILVKNEKGRGKMCQFWEELKEEGRAEERELMKSKIAEAEAKAKAEAKNSAIKKALKMLLSGKLTMEEIADYTNLSIDEVKEFAAITAAR